MKVTELEAKYSSALDQIEEKENEIEKLKTIINEL